MRAPLSRARWAASSRFFRCSPAGPLELGTLLIVPTDGNALGVRLVAPCALGPCDISLAPPVHAMYGGSVRIVLSVASSTDTGSWGDEEWAAALGHLAGHTAVSASLRAAMLSDCSAPLTTSLDVTTTADVASKSVIISADAPSESSLPGGSATAVVTEVAFAIRVCGRPITACDSAGVVRVPLRKRGVSTPLSLPLDYGQDIMYPKPAVSRDGRIFVPVRGDRVRVWNATGKPLAYITSNRISGLHCVAVDDDAGLLYLGGSRLVALDLKNPSAPPKWVSDVAAPVGEDGGVAPLPEHGIVFVVNYQATTAWALRATDGAILHSCGGVNKAIHVCVDPLAATLYTFTSSRDFPDRFSYTPAFGFQAVDVAPPQIPYSGSNFHPTAWMPATADLPPCLVIGTWGGSEIIALSLPDCNVVMQRALGNDGDGRAIRVQGLACDPSGCALVICDNRAHVITLPWPSLLFSKSPVE